MAEEAINKKVISKNNSGFPEYLDFDKLRSDSIAYLGQLTGKIWTDYNVHDPGITIMEALIYAVLDLGYRTNLPIADVLARLPGDDSPDNNFYTPAQILGCNPTTITDYRKMLVDIDGVNNAWLTVADDITIDGICNRNNNSAVLVEAEPDCCIDYLNGLYYVYLDIENRFPTDVKKQTTFKDCVVEKVRRILMAHRNLCEDFTFIYVLCKFGTGVCADIELDPDADADKIYIKTVEALRDFFSPSPRFYTLQQLLDKNIPIDEIFAGRPYDTGESHGFVDTQEFEAIHLRKEIHLSDVYSALLAIKGIKAVRNLKLGTCDSGNPPVYINDWVLPIPENYIPEFSIDCCGFHFSKNGTTVVVDFKKFTSYFNLTFSNKTKTLYAASSPYLDAAIEYGVYRSDLGDYLSVQNEFPVVYGIGEGQLPVDVKPERKAQTLQLKGYLLFFDQLLANYLMQLKKVRNLFAFSLPGDQDRHTYFLNQLATVPELNKLLRFKASDNDLNLLGDDGDRLAFPIDRQLLQQKIDSGEANKIRPAKDFRGYTFATIVECDMVMNLLRNDLENGAYPPQIVLADNDQYYFYYFTSLDKIAIIGRNFYPDEQQALRAANSVQFLAALDENYRRFTDPPTNDFSFDIEFNLSGYIPNLYKIIESGGDFNKRRNGFLDHLLARFSERFSDYALLSYRLDPPGLLDGAIRAKEKYLANYPDLSSNRGRAYDYLLDGWNNNNISGFERKFKALAGIDNWDRHSLCNFVVEAEDEEFTISIPYGAGKTFECNKVFDKEMAVRSGQSFLDTLADRPIFAAAEIPISGSFEVYAKDQFNSRYHTELFTNQQEAEDYSIYLNKLFTFHAVKKDVFESSYLYHLQLKFKNKQGEAPLRIYRLPFTDENLVDKLISAPFSEINQEERWEILQPLNNEEDKSHLQPDADWPGEYVDVNAFKIDINDTIEEKPGLFNYEILDRKYHKFKLTSVNEFATSEDAEKDAHHLLFILGDRDHFMLDTDEDSGKPHISVIYKGAVIARSETFKSPDLARKKIDEINAIVAKYRFILDHDKVPDKWRFRYHLPAQDKDYTFESVNEYGTDEMAFLQAQTFAAALPELVFNEKKTQLTTSDKEKRSTTIPVTALVDAEKTAEENKQIIAALGQRQSVFALANHPDTARLESYLKKTERSRLGDYVYRLVDKDNLPAVYVGQDIKLDCTNDKEKRAVFSQISSRVIDYLDISLGSDIIIQKKDAKTGAVWFHYQIRCLNRFDADGKERILFESVRGYLDEAETRKVFLAEYLEVMQMALDEASYDKYIALNEIVLHATDSCTQTDSKVYIPRKTLDEMGSYDADAVRNIISLVYKFPLRSVIIDSDEFKKLFYCDDDVAKEKDFQDKCIAKIGTDCACTDCVPAQIVYYFVVQDLVAGVPDKQWQGTTWYKTASEAMQQFLFFLLLRANRINYTATALTCDCSCKIYIREVLAQSATRFPNPAMAWGITGVEGFICVSQTENAFNTYFNTANCCNSFYVACGNAHAIHPCIYDTPERRNQALGNLVRAAAEFGQHAFPGIFLSDDLKFIVDLQKNPIASFIDPLQGQRMDFCEKLFYLWQFMIKKCNYEIGADNKPVLINDDKLVIAISVDVIPLGEFREKMQEAAYYFPLVKTDDGGSGTKYCVEIKFPYHPPPVPIKPIPKDCGCDGLDPGDPGCYIAWRSPCCYSSCREAFAQYLDIMDILKDPVNYHPVFDCTCNSYGIRLHTMADLVAFNPQCYDSADDVCASVTRAKRLINSEGLHVVEHILLRPHCEKECGCLINNAQPCDVTHCDHFRWSEGTSVDPCMAAKDVCFVPGADPYSFIATVALPAWPLRFRDKESRDLIEQMLYREAPAHVLLRILWLAPHDLCCFETYFKKWSRHLAGKNTCDNNYTICSFIDFLFKRNYECLPDCTECSCSDSIATLPCFEDPAQVDECNKFKFLNQVNEYFCWTTVDCCQYEYSECDQVIQVPVPGPIDMPADPVLVEQPAQPPVIALAENTWMESKERRDLINNRNTLYRGAINDIVTATEDHAQPIPEKARSFLRRSAPRLTQLKELVEETLGNKIPGAKKLAKKQVQAIVQNAVLYYLDRIWFNGNPSEDWKDLSAFLKTHEKKIDLPELFKAWNSKEVLKIQPASAVQMVKKSFG